MVAFDFQCHCLALASYPSFQHILGYFIIGKNTIDSYDHILSPKRGKLCFEHLVMISDAKNNLPLQGTAKQPPKSVFYNIKNEV